MFRFARVSRAILTTPAVLSLGGSTAFEGDEALLQVPNLPAISKGVKPLCAKVGKPPSKLAMPFDGRDSKGRSPPKISSGV
ncbi:hypothetical protein RRG08_007221 [Elysia crispata]|uniref:Uncharacterized protein n=1 Tax=Elysia crispata TaxID=231223 RepID=A0AAE0Z5J2_9GAST|nr:hypothetical protein RRG08_007221 [Elysia crispata]